MKQKLHSTILVIVLFGSLMMRQPVSAAMLMVPDAGNQSATVTIDFPINGLPFPNGTNITNEYSDQGILFSAEDSDLPPEYQKSLGSQENRISANQLGGTFFNLFRPIFISNDPVTEVSVTLIDSSLNPQTHTLTAFDADGNIVDVDSFAENDLFPNPFTLTVSSSGGIAFVVAIEQPYGAEILNQISYTIERETMIDVYIDIKPGSDTNPINPNSSGKTPVAILSTNDFDAPSMVDKASLTFGKTGDEASLASCSKGGEDINGDGLLDLVCHFYTQTSGFQFGSSEGVLKGQTADGISIEGSDAITVVPPNNEEFNVCPFEPIMITLTTPDPVKIPVQLIESGQDLNFGADDPPGVFWAATDLEGNIINDDGPDDHLHFLLGGVGDSDPGQYYVFFSHPEAGSTYPRIQVNLACDFEAPEP